MNYFIGLFSETNLPLIIIVKHSLIAGISGVYFYIWSRRLNGEACSFADLLLSFIGSSIVGASIVAIFRPDEENMMFATAIAAGIVREKLMRSLIELNLQKILEAFFKK